MVLSGMPATAPEAAEADLATAFQELMLAAAGIMAAVGVEALI
jgi:hypothetical protein